MVTARERMQLAQEGQDARNADKIKVGSKIGAQDIVDDAIVQEQAQQMRQSRYRDDMNASEQFGAEQAQIDMLNAMNPNPQSPGIPFDYNQELPDPQGLNMGSQTIEGMQQLNQMQQQDTMIEEASMGADRAIQLLQKGAQPEVVDQMIDQNITDPQVNQMTKEILNQKIINMSNQQQEANATSGSRQVQTGRPPSPVTAAANDILAQSMQTMQPQQPQQQQQQPMR